MPAGQLVDSNVLHTMVGGPVVTIGGEHAPFVSAVLSPGYAGLYQIAVQVPSDLTDGDATVRATLSDRTSTPDVVYLSVAK